MIVQKRKGDDLCLQRIGGNRSEAHREKERKKETETDPFKPKGKEKEITLPKPTSAFVSKILARLSAGTIYSGFLCNECISADCLR